MGKLFYNSDDTNFKQQWTANKNGFISGARCAADHVPKGLYKTWLTMETWRQIDEREKSQTLLMVRTWRKCDALGYYYIRKYEEYRLVYTVTKVVSPMPSWWKQKQAQIKAILLSYIPSRTSLRWLESLPHYGGRAEKVEGHHNFKSHRNPWNFNSGG